MITKGIGIETEILKNNFGCDSFIPFSMYGGEYGEYGLAINNCYSNIRVETHDRLFVE